MSGSGVWVADGPGLVRAGLGFMPFVGSCAQRCKPDTLKSQSMQGTTVQPKKHTYFAVSALVFQVRVLALGLEVWLSMLRQTKTLNPRP